MKINTAKDLGAILKDKRKAQKWSQSDLAERIGVYQRDISNYETKPEKMSVETLIKLCAALHLDFKVSKPFSKTAKTVTLPKLNF